MEIQVGVNIMADLYIAFGYSFSDLVKFMKQPEYRWQIEK